jgi:serralysin
MFDPLNGRVLYEFFPFDQRFTGGVRVACRDIDGDGTPDMICTSGPGISTTVRIFSGNGGQLLHEFTPFEPWWAGGAFVGCR